MCDGGGICGDMGVCRCENGNSEIGCCVCVCVGGGVGREREEIVCWRMGLGQKERVVCVDNMSLCNNQYEETLI